MLQRGLKRWLSETLVPGGLKIFTTAATDAPQVLVTRPQKGVFWGKGGQYVKVQRGKMLISGVQEGAITKYSQNCEVFGSGISAGFEGCRCVEIYTKSYMFHCDNWARTDAQAHI